VEKTPHAIHNISDSIRLSGDQRVQLRSVVGVERTSNRLADPAAMVRDALEEPLDFPPLAAGTVPGDHVAIAVDRGVPSFGEVVRGCVESFERAGINLEDISIVATDAETLRLCREVLHEGATTRPQFVLHDPDDNDNLCLVGHTKRHEPLLVNRTIFDADIVLPIGCARPGGGVYDFLFPAFSNAAAIDDFRTPANVNSPADAEKKTKEANEAGWLIGVMMTMQVVPGADETVAHVVAGEPQAVAQRCEQLYEEQWSLRSPREVSLVIANISGGPEAQNWQNVGRALATAESVLSEGGAVAICTNLDTPPGESLARLIGSEDLEKTQRKILHDHAEDSVSAWHMARALQRGPVYFLSQLDPETVEELGLAPISNIDELTRLAGRRESYIVIDDAQHAIVTIG
jgi:nickel-dependent lactate racemase